MNFNPPPSQPASRDYQNNVFGGWGCRNMMHLGDVLNQVDSLKTTQVLSVDICQIVLILKSLNAQAG